MTQNPTHSRYQTVLLFGAPGTGKGTQGKILGCIPGFFHLSCGDVFRAIDEKSEVGRKVYEYTSRGELVPDDITVKLWKQNMDAQTALRYFKPAQDLLVLDGIPRNVPQAEFLDEHCEVLCVIHLTCDDEEAMISRLRRRALKENRSDDAREEIIRHRWEVYREESEPVLDYYDDGIIHGVNAVASPVAVLQHVLEIVVPVQERHFGNTLA